MSYAPPPAYKGSNDSSAGEPPLDQPYYGAPLGAAVKRFFTKYATFSGRASRSEFWWWFLVSVVISIVFSILRSALTGSDAAHPGAGSVVITVISGIWSLAILIPSLAVAWRRLHDTNRAGGWYFIGLIPVIGTILVIVWLASASKADGQRFDR
jgi:uncharacterized membrane protein YhaH (DUF805 family)